MPTERTNSRLEYTVCSFSKGDVKICGELEVRCYLNPVNLKVLQQHEVPKSYHEASTMDSRKVRSHATTEWARREKPRSE